MSTLTDLFTNIAAAIRSKTGGAGTIVASNFPSAISGIVTLAGGSADATAAATEILGPKTAYVQGVKVTGSMPTFTSYPGTAYPKDVNGNFGMLTGIAGYYPKDAIVYANAAACGITPEKILQGESILGVAGTRQPGSTFEIAAPNAWSFAVPGLVGKSSFCGVFVGAGFGRNMGLHIYYVGGVMTYAYVASNDDFRIASSAGEYPTAGLTFDTVTGTISIPDTLPTFIRAMRFVAW